MTTSSRRHHSRIVTAAAALAIATPIAVAATPASADHTETPAQVTLVGSLQEELGCPQDWDPGCAETTLEPTDEAGIFTAQFSVPAGSYAYKIAIGGGWDENYGAGGEPGGADMPLVLLHDAELTVSYNHATHRVAVAPADPQPGLTDGDRELASVSLRDDLTRERFYFVMTDRFENGDHTNDTGGYEIPPGTAPEDERLIHGFDPTDKGFYHGGDIAGLIDRLDYIADLGTTAIWLTPSFKNRPVQGSGDDISAGYHGYWITDFTQIDPHLGTNDELDELIEQAHARDIKIFFDIITNHTADVIDYAEGEYTYISKDDQPYRDADGTPFDDRDFAASDTFPELDPAGSFPYTPIFNSPEDASVKVPEWLNDPIYYHNRGNATFDGGESDEYGDFFGLDDLFTEHPDVRQGMIDIYSFWAAFGIDGFRIDTVKHVNMEFWHEFVPAVMDAAHAAGKDEFFMFGEVFDSNPEVMSRYTAVPPHGAGLQATADFGFQARAAGFATGRPTTELRDFYALDDYYINDVGNAYSLPTFLGNHDMGRIGMFIRDAGATGDALLERDLLAHSLMYLTRGQPVVYYGDEQGFTGDGGDKDARENMFPSQVESYNDNDLIGTDATTADENFDTDHPIYRHIAEVAALREAHPALADGAQIHRYASNSAGIYAISRIDADEQVEYIVAANNADDAKTATFATFNPSTTFHGLWPNGTDRVRADKEGRVTVTVPARSVSVWKAPAKLKKRSHDVGAPSSFFNTPGPGGTVGGRAEVGVSVPAGGFNQVTLAWRPVGGEDWTVLGTDDNAPYRVFHDVSGLDHGTLLEYRAILADHSGNLSVTGTYASVGDPAPPGPGPDPGDGGPVTQPGAVSIPGNLNPAMGCPGEWQPDCDQAQLTLDPTDDIWKGTYALPAGDWQYKVAIDRSWAENYGANARRDGPNIPLALSADTDVTFYYDHATHWVTTDAQDPIVTVAGSFQQALGCPGDWDPSCMRSWLKDINGDGTYTFSTTAIPAGSHEVKVTHGLSWAENYGAGGVPDGPNIPFSVPAGARTTFTYDLATNVLTVTTSESTAPPALDQARAHWLARELIAWDLPAVAEGWTFRLHHAPTGGLAVDAEAVTGGTSVPLTRASTGLPADIRDQYPHLASYDALQLAPKDAKEADRMLTGQVAVAAYDDLGKLVDATSLQIPGVLDDVYPGALDADLGVTWKGRSPWLAVWAPTAKNVTLLVRPDGATSDQRVTMRRDKHGVWQAKGAPAWKGGSYLYEVEVYVPETGQVETNLVTDPYSVALTTDSQRTVIADLADPALTPPGWASLAKPELAKPDDSAIYELHVRDFSITDESVSDELRGTYLAFTEDGSEGMRHLRELADAGMNTLHLLPVFDITTVPERRGDQLEPPCDLPALTAANSAGTEQQACIDSVRDQDGFNWGYDPWHYTVPEGSYATDPEGPRRTREFREMVAAINALGLRVVVDVVYNHTHAAGQDDKSVLDRIVPGYYQRLSATGVVETSTCCPNTATEHAMMEKLTVDSVVTWAREYKVDGFRFDLMGHHSRDTMEKVRAALDELTIDRDGVDGASIYVYGEGWNFGEVADNARFRQASQLEMYGAGIGTFSDRLRDAVRGGGPFDDDPRIQGFASGLYLEPNESPENGSEADQLARMLLHHDQIKVGLAGNLRDYTFVDRTGETVTGADVDYNGQPAGYAASPAETITYVDAHDNETLFDALTYKLPVDTSMADKARMNTVALATTALSQGPSFWHAGTDILRSKSLDRDSYNSGDWFNRVDWTYQESTFGSGLPPRSHNEQKWPFMEPLLADPALKPAPDDIEAARQGALDLLRLRFSSPLFRLGSAELVQAKVSFPHGGPTQTPGVIVMVLDDRVGEPVDPDRERLVVVFNASPDEQTVPLDDAGSLRLHPVQDAGADDVVKQTVVSSGSITIPGRTVAVLEVPADSSPPS
jgi:pullulanase-type alpha-1,6-glucosidase